MSPGRPGRERESVGDEVQRASRAIVVPVSIDIVTLFGPRDAFLRALEDRLVANIHVHDNQVAVTGEPGDVASAVEILTELITIVRTGQGLNEETVERTINLATEDLKPSETLTADIISARDRTMRPETLNQKHYVDAIDRHTVVFRVGPAGTGKTYLVMAKTVQAPQSRRVSHVILTRPAIRTGERLGFLPSTLSDKIDPYLRPLYDALHDMVEAGSMPKFLTSGIVEIAPLAYIRGRTLNDTFIILDETQNISSEQIKMFLTRLGFDSKMVVTGNIIQVDLPDGVCSGLRQVTQILDGAEDTVFCTLTTRDVVRHGLVDRIVAAYDSYDNIQQGRGGR